MLLAVFSSLEARPQVSLSPSPFGQVLDALSGFVNLMLTNPTSVVFQHSDQTLVPAGLDNDTCSYSFIYVFKILDT